MPYAAGNGGSINQSPFCYLHSRHDRGMFVSFTMARRPPSTLTGTVQRNVLRKVLRSRRARPNGDWRLLRGPADIFMVRSEFYSLFESHSSRSGDSLPFLHSISYKRRVVSLTFDGYTTG